jgi:hypothetical protein
MKVIATKAEEPRTTAIRNGAWAYAAVLVVMTLGQLYAFEKFIPLLENYRLPGEYGTAAILASVIVIAEVLALPFLLRMTLSPLMRWVSLFSGLLVAGLWFGLALISMNESPAFVSGLFGVKVPLYTGIAFLILTLLIAILAVWSASGLWPSRKK